MPVIYRNSSLNFIVRQHIQFTTKKKQQQQKNTNLDDFKDFYSHIF